MFRLSSLRRGAPCGAPSAVLPESVLALAASLQRHKGLPVYHSRADALAVLKAVADARPAFWTPDCDGFVARVAALPERRVDFPLPAATHHLVVVVEGLDGVGKTTATTALARRLGGSLVRTPDPALEPLRATFRAQPESIARAFYCAANYVGAEAVAEAAERGPVVVDRWWGSTCAMAVASLAAPPPPATNAAAAPLRAAAPAAGSAAYAWPRDLPRFDLGVVLAVDERIRRLRLAGRGDENAEEALLAARRDMREAAMRAYACMTGDAAFPRHGYRVVDTSTYMVAVNTILGLLVEGAEGADACEVLQAKWRRVAASVRPFSEEELATVKPY